MEAATTAPRGAGYWNQRVVERISKDTLLSPEEAARLFHEMLRFLELSASTDEILAPSEPVDDAWHAFLLHTRDYTEFCRDHLGVFVHHEPTSPDHDVDGRATAYERTRELLLERYGELPDRYWPVAGADCRCAGCHGVGDS